MVSISLALVLAIITWLLIRYYGLKMFHAVIVTLFGFYLAKTALAPEIQRFVSAVIDAMSALRLH